jgi:hypothetical protein
MTAPADAPQRERARPAGPGAAAWGGAVTRRGLGRLSLSALAYSVAHRVSLAEQVVPAERKPPAKSLIVLWLDGGPSQLETFDPQPGGAIGGPTQAIPTAAPGLRIAAGLPRLAEQMHTIALVRSMTSKEGDHERGRYLLKTGYRMNPTVVHPSLGAICAAQLPRGRCDLPLYVGIMSNDRISRGGYLGNEYDPFRIDDPAEPLPDVTSRVPVERRRRRLDDLAVVEQSFARRYAEPSKRTQHQAQVSRALQMMDSAQLRAFRVEDEPAAVRAAYGDSPFGRGCLAARRLVEAGVRCIEVTLGGWDLHANNFEGTAALNRVLDPAFAALVADLRTRQLLDDTVVLCLGEFGRTPKINALDGRDHWPEAFSIAVAGGGARGGQFIGETDPNGGAKPRDPIEVPDLYATVLTLLGIRPETTIETPVGRPIRLSEGKPIARLLAAG